MASLYGIDVTITFEITGWFEDETKVLPHNVTVTVGPGNELIADIEARVLSDIHGNGQIQPVPGPNGLLTGQVVLDIRENQVFASFSGQAQPAGFKIKIEGLKPDGVAPGTIADQGSMNGVNMVNTPSYNASTGTLTFDWFFLGFQPGTVVDQTVFYDNQLEDAPVANDDYISANANAVFTGLNVLDNDTDLDNGGIFGIVDPTKVGAVEGSAANVGQWVDLGERGKILINVDGSLSFDPAGRFSDLAVGETREVEFNYTAEDTTGRKDAAKILVTVTGVNTPPTDISISYDRVNQSAGIDAVVGSLSTTDIDPSDTHTYTLVAGAGDTDNASFNISGSELRVNDAEALSGGSYSIRIRTMDSNGGSYEESITITIVDDIAPLAPTIKLASDSGEPGDLITKESSPTFTGTAEPNSTVTIYANDEVNGTTSANLEGIWTFTAKGEWDDAEYEVTATATDAAGQESPKSMPLTVTIDTKAPTASIVVAESILASGDTSVVTITFNEEVLGLSSDRLNAANGTLSELSSSDGRKTWTTTFTPDVNIEVAGNVITLDLAGITDIAGNSATGEELSNIYTVDTIRPAVTSVTPPADGTYKAGQQLNFTVNFGETVTVDTTDGTPQIAITLDASDKVFAQYVFGSGTNSLLFSLTIEPNWLDKDGIELGHVLDLNGGVITDQAGNTVIPDLNAVGSTSGILVDAVNTDDGGGGTPTPQPEQPPEEIPGSPGDDVFQPRPVDAVYDGGDGFDKIIYTGTRDSYDVTVNLDGTIVLVSAGYTHTLIAMDRVQFDDGTLGLPPEKWSSLK